MPPGVPARASQGLAGRDDSFMRIGHRGAPFQAFENTITSFRKAIELGSNAIELDVHLCASGELVVFHDDGFGRHTSCKALVRNLTLTEIRALALPGGERVSTLPEVLEVLPRDLFYFVELKPAEAVKPLVEMLTHYTERGWKNLILISFLHDALEYSPVFALGLTFHRGERCDNAKAKAMGAAYVLPYHGSVTQQEVEEAHGLGLKVAVWTANAPKDIARVKALGVDGIMSDYPERL